MSVTNFPSLTGEEFLEACHHLDQKYCQATLGPLRSRWRLNVKTPLNSIFTIYGIPSSYVEITRPLDRKPGMDDLELALGDFSMHDITAGESKMEIEEADEFALKSPRLPEEAGQVTYEIHLHPTYRMPCLWFHLNLPQGENPWELDTVFHHLVPREYKDGLRRYGGVGGLSIDHHPLTGNPCWFVHPCLAGDQMSGFSCTRENYLTIWLGLVGGCVGLWVHKEMAMR